MNLGVVKETFPGEKRVALIPPSVERLTKRGLKIYVEGGLGQTIKVSDEDYKKAGAEILDRKVVLTSSDIIARIRKPPQEEIAQLKKNCVHISFLDPFNEQQLIDTLAK